jgi:endonuclease YncB( thermonuclease family)
MPAQTFGPYPALCVDVHDGDTIAFDIDLGFDHLISAKGFKGESRLSCRVYGINAPELKTATGKLALDYAKTLIKPGDVCQILSYGWDKYGGRFNGSITLGDGRDFAQAMLDAGHAKKFIVR